MREMIEFDKSNGLELYPFSFEWQSSDFLSEIDGKARDIYNHEYRFYIKKKYGELEIYVYKINANTLEDYREQDNKVYDYENVIYRSINGTTGWKDEISLSYLQKYIGHIIKF